MMMNQMMAGASSHAWIMGSADIVVAVLVVLSIAALVKYHFFTGSR
jgi:hypothetical protein